MSYLIDFLRGSHAKTIRDEHKNLPTYGVGADISKNQWFDYFKDLIAQGYLKQTDGQYPSIVLTEKSGDVLRGSVTVELIKAREQKEEKTTKTHSGHIPQYLKDLFDDLRRLRSEYAREDNVPPYVVFSDATLMEMAAYLPQTLEEMRRISGVGDLKLERYGPGFLREVVGYCRPKGLASRIELKSTRRERKPRTIRDRSGKNTYDTSLEMYRQGMTVDQIAATRNISSQTVETHLIRFIPTGEISLEDIVPAERIDTIKQAIYQSGSNGFLGPVKSILGDDYSYTEIRAVFASMGAYQQDQ
jgi:ATP-dependent DNA helicase RecQ